MTLKNSSKIQAIVFSIFIFSAFFMAKPAQAYRSAAIATMTGEMKQSPDPNSSTIQVIPKGTRVNTSDKPTNGFFKVRSATATGWVRASDLYFYNKTSAVGSARSSRKPPRKYSFVVKAFGGLDLWSPNDINQLIGSSALSDGAGLGLEIGYVLTTNLTAVLRFEHLSKTTTGTNNYNGSATPVELDYSASPIMVGVDYRLIQWDGWSLEGSGLVGLASPSLIGTIGGSSDTTNFGGSAATLLVKLDLNWEFSDWLWLFGELGYRYLKTGQADATQYGNGSQINPGGVPTPGFFLNSSGAAVPIGLDMSGPVINLGARINF